MKKQSTPGEDKRTPNVRASMNWREIFTQILVKEFEHQKARNSRLSMRQWAKKIGASSGVISELLAGRRNVTEEKALAILEAAKVSLKDRRRLLAHMGNPSEVTRVAPKREHIDLIRDWINQAICGMYEMNAFPVDAAAISERLAVPRPEIEERTKVLLKAGLLQKDTSGKIFRVSENWDISLTLSQEEMFQLKLDALARNKDLLPKIDLADATLLNLAFPGNLDQIKFLKKGLMKLVNAVNAMSESEKRDELIQFSVQLFPYRFGKKEK